MEGRKKDLINRGGEKISAEEIENLILTHPAVLNISCVPMPDPVLGERMCAFIIQPEASLTLKELTSYLMDQGLAKFKLPERLELVDDFPAGSMATTKRPGWERLGIITGTVYVFLRAIALIVPDYAGSWGEAAGLFAVFGGALYILITLAEMENMRRHEQARTAQATITDNDGLASEAGTMQSSEKVSAAETMLVGTGKQ